MSTDRKTLIFDFGNVLIGLDHVKHLSAFKKLFPGDWTMEDYPFSINSAYKKYEVGRISDDEFISAFHQINNKAERLEIIDAWCDLIGEMKKETLSMLEGLSSDYQLVLLSNINNLHHLYIQRYLVKYHGVSDFEENYFDKVFYSHLINLSKPDPQIYSFVENELNVNPEDILFMDDRLENIEAAAERSWNVQLHKPEDDISIKISEYLKQHSF